MFELVSDVILAALAVRVFGRDVIVLMRRAAVASVRLGVSELELRGAQWQEKQW